ncbi:type II toxin-antitoxin system MqsR family toxin [Caballeronia sordidicola]|uniref:type II toxin-antitoxin system MqsR family toxin n=1 Tax=Caballeronia sordidicola TaxID=196367 RepID=UPI0009F9CD86|nr:type II toxin-antitoxin system MqsR family toxin [Caballeronia sordidicola]
MGTRPTFTCGTGRPGSCRRQTKPHVRLNAPSCTLGFDFDEMAGRGRGTEDQRFFKSMTTYDDHKIWQDVYRPTTSAGPVYLKLTVINDVLIVSFKEL